MIRKSKDKEGDPFDSEDVNYFNKLVDGYDDMAEKKWRGINWFVVDGERSEKAVSEAINGILDKIVNK